MKLPLSKTLKKDISSTNEPGERRRWDDKIASCFEIHSKQRFRIIEKDVNESVKLNDSDLLLEKGHKKLDDKKWETFKKTIKANLEDIRNRKDEILKKSYED